MAVLVLLVAIVGCVLAKPSSENVKPVEVTFYYSVFFHHAITKGLLPAYTDTKFNYSSLISKLTLVPFSWAYNANQTTYNFKTKRGQFESDGNRLRSCATKYIPDVLTTLNYISCLEKLEKHQQGYAPFEFGIPPKYPIDKCKNKLPAGLYPKIINCYRSDEGWELYEENKEKSKPLLPKAGTIPFPYVSFNDEHDDVLAQDAVDNFKSTLCKVTGVVDKACSL